jgi:hypothetical protein
VLKRPLREYFRSSFPLLTVRNIPWIVLFAATIVVPLFTTFIPGLRSTPLVVVLLAIPLATIHGFLEELFWRGLYAKEFAREPLWAIVIPTFLFAAWHIAPQLAIPSTHMVPFLILTVPLGLTYAIVAYVTKSALWSAVGHTISGILAFSGLLSESFYHAFLA